MHIPTHQSIHFVSHRTPCKFKQNMEQAEQEDVEDNPSTSAMRNERDMLFREWMRDTREAAVAEAAPASMSDHERLTCLSCKSRFEQNYAVLWQTGPGLGPLLSDGFKAMVRGSTGLVPVSELRFAKAEKVGVKVEA